jgi:hypothetical protein
VRTVPTDNRVESDAVVVTVTRGTERSTVEITDTGRREIKPPSMMAAQPSPGPRPEQ